MQIGARTAAASADGFRVVMRGARIGWVEEEWLDDQGAATAFAVRLPDGRRGLLIRDGIEEVRVYEREIAVRRGARLLELEPPHLDTGSGGILTASWTTSGSELALPGSETPSGAPTVSTSEPSFLTTVSVLYAALFVIGCALTGVCFLVPYLVSGRPY